MPLYEYQCEACGHRFETIQKFSDAPLEQCPRCAGVVHKLQSAPAFQFKGSGWYITDYARKEQGGGKDKEGGAAAKGDGNAAKGDAKSDKTDSGSSSAPSTAAAAPAASGTSSGGDSSGTKPS